MTVQTTQTTAKTPVKADLGSGSFTVDDYTVTEETRVSELPLLGGGCDRRIIGWGRVYTLTGRVLPQDISFFDTLCRSCAGTVLSSVTIAGRVITNLFVPKAELIRPAGSLCGSFRIILREL